MGFFSRSRDKFQLRSLVGKYQKYPSVETLVKLVHCQLRLGMISDACRFAGQGVKRFPESDLIREMLRIAQLQRAKKAIQEARREIKEASNPKAFLKLARESLQVGDSETALTALHECVKKYPECAAAYSLLAQIHEKRFLRDLSSNDGSLVVKYSKHASRLDPSDPEPQIRLAQFFDTIDATNWARQSVEQVLVRDHRHVVARELMDRLSKTEAKGLEDVESVLMQIEEVGCLPGDDVGERRRVNRELIRLRAALETLETRLPDCRSAVLDPQGDAWDEHGRLEMDAFVGLASGLANTAQLATRRMGLGPLRGVTLQGQNGAMVMRRGARSTLVCILPVGTPLRGSQDILRSVVSGQPLQPEQPEATPSDDEEKET